MKTVKVALIAVVAAGALSARAFTHSSIITTSGYSGSAALANFPVLVKIDATHIPGFDYALCRADGRDISFTSVDGSVKYPYEVDTWNPSGTSLVWVKLPEVTAATQFRFCFGDKTHFAPPRANDSTNVWNNANNGFYIGVWHMNESALTGAEKSPDSAKHGSIDLDAVPRADGRSTSTTPVGDVSRMTSVAGQVGSARRIDTATRTCGQSFMLNSFVGYAIGNNATISFWTKANAAPASESPIICRSCRSNQGYAFNIVASSTTSLFVQGAGSPKLNVTVPDLTAAWRHVAVVYRSNKADVYVDGVQLANSGSVSTFSDTSSVFAPYVQFGNYVGNSGNNYPGDLDEVRILKSSVSADWVKAEYDTAASDAFLSAATAVEAEIVDPAWTVEAPTFPVGLYATSPDTVLTVDGAAVSQGVVYLTEGAHAVTATGGGTFLGWSGALAGETSSSATLMVGEEGTLATAITSGGEPGTITWSAADEGEWYDAANWDLGRVPGAGDAVVLPAGAMVRIDAPTPALASLTVAFGATLVARNWSTKIDGGVVMVAGTVKTEGYFYDGEMSNRVWIAGTTLNVPAGGKVSADAAGYAGRNGPAWVGATRLNFAYTSKGLGTSKYGGAYGGDQGYDDTEHHVNNVRHSNYVPPHMYGSAEWPFDPGSGGGPYYAAGGGAVYLQFSGAVTVDGTVSADSNSRSYQWDDFLPGNGSGGGIVIVCDSIAGSGTVSARGLSPTKANGSLWDYTTVANAFCGNGGGRIAVHYRPAAQRDATCSISFTTAGGCGTVTARPLYCGAVGSLWFTDDSFLTTDATYRANGWSFVGTWHSGTLGDSLLIPHDVVANAVGPAFPYVGFTLAFGGNLAVNGTGVARQSCFGLTDGSFRDNGISNGTMTVAGNLSLCGARLEVKRGTLEVGGDFTMSRSGANAANNAEFRLYSGVTNGTENLYGAATRVGGTWDLRNASLVMAYCDQLYGAIPHFEVKNLIVATNAIINADEKGFLNGKGPGVSKSNNVGSSHGGHGGRNNATATIPPIYDDMERPCMPGSGGTSGSWFYGGGVVWIDAISTMTIHGKVSANADRDGKAWTRSGGGEAVPSSGGTVRLSARKFFCDGYLQAMGAGSTNNRQGGGGRIAVWSRINLSPELEDLTSEYSQTHVDVRIPAAIVLGEAGTVYFGRLKADGTRILVR